MYDVLSVPKLASQFMTSPSHNEIKVTSPSKKKKRKLQVGLALMHMETDRIVRVKRLKENQITENSPRKKKSVLVTLQSTILPNN